MNTPSVGANGLAVGETPSIADFPFVPTPVDTSNGTSPWAQFDGKFVLTYSGNTSRAESLKRELTRIGMENVEFCWNTDDAFAMQLFTGFYDESHYLSKPHRFQFFNNAIGHYRIIKGAYQRGMRHILVMEDDIRFLSDLVLLSASMRQLPQDYEVAMLDSHPTDTQERIGFGLTGEQVNQYWRKVINRTSAGCYALSREGMKKMISLYEHLPLTNSDEKFTQENFTHIFYSTPCLARQIKMPSANTLSSYAWWCGIYDATGNSSYKYGDPNLTPTSRSNYYKRITADDYDVEPQSIYIHPPAPVHFMTFATSDWPVSIRRAKVQVGYIQQAAEFFSTTTFKTEYNLPKSWSSVFKDPSKLRGYGLYTWKPVIIEEELMKIPEGDFLMYLDAGCTFPVVKKLPSFLDNVNRAIVALCHEGADIALARNPNYQYCVADISAAMLKFFDLESDDKFTHGFPHWEAGAMIIRNSVRSRALVKCWKDTLLENLKALFSEPEVGLPGFIQNSCDQPVLQALLYKQRIPILDVSELFYGYGIYTRLRG